MNYIKKKKTAAIIRGLGCPRSLTDAGLMFNYFRANGWELTTSFQEADLVMFGTCAVTSHDEKRSLEHLDLLSKKIKNGAQIVAFGCLPGIIEVNSGKNNGLIAVAPKKLDELDDIISAEIGLSQVEDGHGYNDLLRKTQESYWTTWNGRSKFLRSIRLAKKAVGRYCFRGRRRPKLLHTHYEGTYDIRIAKGCRGECTYCAIRFAAGPLRSKSIDTILGEFSEGLSSGNSVFRLVAGDVGGYGEDIGTTVVELLRRIFELRGGFKLMWSDFSPKWFIKHNDELINIISGNSSKIEYIGFPVQSGSEKILKSMRRGYTADDCRRYLGRLLEVLPDIDISTHVLLGFPGETTSDFHDTVSLLRSVRFKHVLVYEYSDRPRTIAAGLDNKVPSKVIKSRHEQLRREFPSICS